MGTAIRSQNGRGAWLAWLVEYVTLELRVGCELEPHVGDSDYSDK